MFEYNLYSDKTVTVRGVEYHHMKCRTSGMAWVEAHIGKNVYNDKREAWAGDVYVALGLL
jgi:hypothetical protein